MQIKLKDGLKVAEDTIYHLTLRKLTTADLMDAELESESAVRTPAGIMLLSSPAKMGYELIRRSVCKVGDASRSLEPKELRHLTEQDFKLLEKHYHLLNNATAGDGLSAEGR